MSIQEAVENGARPDQAIKYATADVAMEVIAERVPVDELLGSAAGNPKRAAGIMDAVLKQYGIRMTGEELGWLGRVAAEASRLQQHPAFTKVTALEMLKGLNSEQAYTAASKVIWQQTLDWAADSGAFEGTSSLDENVVDGREALDNNALTKPGEVEASLDSVQDIPEADGQQEVVAMDEVGVEDAGEKRFQDLLEKAKTNDIIEFDDELEDIVAGKSFEELEPLLQKLPNRAVRKWYLAQDAQIPLQIDRSLDIEGQARQAFDLRNQNRTRARDLMLDQEERKRLDITDPNKTFEEMVEYKMKKYQIDREKAIEDILRTATITRQSVNEKYGLG